MRAQLLPHTFGFFFYKVDCLRVHGRGFSSAFVSKLGFLSSKLLFFHSGIEMAYVLRAPPGSAVGKTKFKARATEARLHLSW